MINPYIDSYGDARPVAGAIRPAPQAATTSSSTRRRRRRPAFTFRFWIDDVTPPTVRLVLGAPRGAAANLELSVTDAGVGRRPAVPDRDDRRQAARTSPTRAAAAVVSLVARLGPGTARARLHRADYQELKNMENVPQILPNTRIVQGRRSASASG